MATDDDIESYLDPVSLNRAVRGGDKLQGVQPELLNHWNNLQGEFTKAGLTPEIKSGFRTAQQQQSLYNNPRTRALTKGNDGINRLSPHQEGRALDISFPATQRAKGRQVIADYAQRNGLTVPSDEPWHVAIPRQGKAGVESYLDPQQPTQSAQQPKPIPNIESYLDPQEPIVAAGRGAAMARAQGSRQPVTRGAQRKVEQGWGGGGIIGQGVSSVSVNAMGGSQANGVGGLRQIDDPETSRIIRAQRQVTAEQTPAERTMQRAPGTADARLFDPHLSENEEVLRRVAAEKDQETQLAKQTAWEQENKAEIDRHVADYRKQIQDSGFTKWLTETQARGAGHLLEFPAGAADIVGATKAANAIRVRAVAAAQAAQEEGKGRSEASQFIQETLGSFAGSAPELLLMQAGVPPIATFAAGGGLRAKGMGRLVAPAVTQGALTGAAFEIPEAGAPGVRGTLTRAGKVGAATAGVDLATGAPVSQALKSGVVNAAMVAGPGLITKGRAPEVASQSESRTVVPDINAQLAAREAAVKPITDAQGNVLLNADEVAQGGKPKIRLAQRGTDEAQNIRPASGQDSGIVSAGLQDEGSVPAVSQEGLPPDKHYSNYQPRRARNTETGNKGQFKAGKPEVAQSVPQPDLSAQDDKPLILAGGFANPNAPKYRAKETIDALGEPNPINPHERVLDGVKFKTETRAMGDNEIYLDIESFERGKGNASKVLDKILDAAKQEGVDVVGLPKAFGEGGLSTEQLKQWYARHGFEPYRQGLIIKRASEPAAQPAIPDATNLPIVPPVGAASEVVPMPERSYTIRDPSGKTVSVQGDDSLQSELEKVPEGQTVQVQGPSGIKYNYEKPAEPAPPVPQLYHGTDADFAAFDISAPRRGKGDFGRGIYLTPSIERARLEGRNIHSVETDLKKPLRMDALTSDAVKRITQAANLSEARSARLDNEIASLAFQSDYEAKAFSLIEKAVGANQVTETLKRAGFDGVIAPDSQEYVLFDTSAIKRSSQEPPVPEGKPTEPTVSPIKPELSTTSARTVSMQADREALGLEQIPRPTVQKDAEVFDRAKVANAKDATEPSRIADKVLTGDHRLSSLETAQIVLRAQDVKNQHKALLREIAGETDSDVIRSKGLEAEALKREYDKLSEADERGGTEQARAFRIRQRRIDDEFDLLPVLARMKVAKGRDLTTVERQKYTDMVAERDQALLDRDAALERAHTAELQKQINRSTRQRKRSGTKESLDAEAATIKTNIASEFARLKAAQSSVHSAFGLGSLDPEGVITKELVKYARNRVKANVGLKAEALIDEVHDLVKDFASRRQVAEVLSGYMKPRDAREVDVITKQLADIRKEIKTRLAQQDVEAGIRTERTQGPTIREGQREKSRRRSEIAEGLRDQQTQAQAELSIVKRGSSEGGAELARDARKQAKEFRDQQSAERETEERAYREAQTPEQREAAKQQRTPEGPSRRYVTRNEQRLKQLQAKEADLTARMAAGDYSARPRTQPLPYNREVTAAQERVGRIEQRFNDEAAKREPKTILDYLVKWKRFAVLSRPSTLLKLGSAAVGRMGVTPLEEAIGGAVSKVLPDLAERAPREGRFNFRAEAKAISQMWQGDTFRDAVKQITTGKDSLDILYGDKHGDTEMLNFPGRVHGAIKELPKRAEFFRSFEKRLESAGRQGRDVSDPDVQMGIAMEAYTDARRAIFQQPNPISDAFTNTVKSLERGGRGSKVLGKALQFAFPVTRVPVNVVGETLNYALGAPRAVAQTAYLKLFKDGFSSLSPEQADSLMRAYKKGGVGLGVMALAYLNPQMFGGYYQRGEKRDPKTAQPGEMIVAGQRVPKLLIHTPFFEAMQVGATVRRVSDAMKAKEKGGLTEGAEAAGLGLAHEVPFYETPRRYFEGVESGGQALRKVAYGEAKSMIPGVVQEVAEQTDRQNGQVVKRSSGTLSETLKSGIPGLRQTVPEKNSSGKLLNSRSGNDPLVKELMRIDHQVNGVSKSPDESQPDFEKRRAAVNPQIEADLKDLVDSREYKSLSDADKKEQITMHLRSVTKTANENYYLQNGGEKVKTPRQVYIAPQRAVAP